jgi:hypothetical protein
MKNTNVKVTANFKLKTYNIRVPGMKSLDIVEALNFGVSTSGALVFKGKGDSAIKAYNKDEWFEVWEV